MTKYIVIALITLAATGILLISFVQIKIIIRHGIRHFQQRGFINVYWHDRTSIERWCFWGGFSLLIMPFIFAGVISMINV